MIRVNDSIAIDESELQFEFIRATGPGGQNVNKVASAVQLRFDAGRSPALPADVRERLARLAGRRMTASGILIIHARRFRTQERNRQDAIDRLVDLVRQASEKPRPRRPTRPPLAQKRRRLETKRRRSQTKRLRGPLSLDED